MLSVAPERPLSPITLGVLKHVHSAAGDLGFDYFVAGAIARNILLFNVFGLDEARATLDVDLAIGLDSWLQFDKVKARLVETGIFAVLPQNMHRLSYRPHPGQGGSPVDLLPFGGVEQRPDEIAWPPDLSVIMNVAGYREALIAALEVELEPGFVSRIASLPGLAVLKLFAWSDRGQETQKDALDLAILLRRYAAAGNEDRLFGEEIDLLETVNYDHDLAGPRLLGKDVARLITPLTRDKIVALFDDSRRIDRLLRDIARGFIGSDDPVAQAEASIGQFRAGLQGQA